MRKMTEMEKEDSRSCGVVPWGREYCRRLVFLEEEEVETDITTLRSAMLLLLLVKLYAHVAAAACNVSSSHIADRPCGPIQDNVARPKRPPVVALRMPVKSDFGKSRTVSRFEPRCTTALSSDT